MPLFLDCDLEKLLKPDPGNTELLAQKHRLLGETVTATKEKLETLKTAAEQANTALANGDISKEQYDVLQREKNCSDQYAYGRLKGRCVQENGWLEIMVAILL